MRIENYSAAELFEQLNDIDESQNVEAKALSQDSTRSLLETVCSYSNEPGLGGGVILLGVAENAVYRQLSGMDTLHASAALTKMRDLELLVQAGKGRATYYIPGPRLSIQPRGAIVQPQGTIVQPQAAIIQPQGLTIQPQPVGTLQPQSVTLQPRAVTLQPRAVTLQPQEVNLQARLTELRNNEKIANILKTLKRRNKSDVLNNAIVSLCAIEPLQQVEVAGLLGFSEQYVRPILYKLVSPKGPLYYTIPDMIHHPRQAYTTIRPASNLQEVQG